MKKRGLIRLAVIYGVSLLFFVTAQVVAFAGTQEAGPSGVPSPGLVFSGPQDNPPPPKTMFVQYFNTDIVYLRPDEVSDCPSGRPDNQCQPTRYLRDEHGCVFANTAVWQDPRGRWCIAPDGSNPALAPTLPTPPKGYEAFQDGTERNVQWRPSYMGAAVVQYDDCWIGETTSSRAMICDRWHPENKTWYWYHTDPPEPVPSGDTPEV